MKAAAVNKSSPTSPTSPQPSSPHRVRLQTLCGVTSDAPGASFVSSAPEVSALRAAPHLIVDVWASNLREVFSKLLWIVDDYPYIALDTEFPGVIARPIGAQSDTTKARHAFHYQTIKMNVDMMRVIQLGMCFCTAEGEVSRGVPVVAGAPGSAASLAAAQPGGIVYQFHFKFSLTDDLYSSESIELLQHAGIDFARHAREGIDVLEFAELLLTSGIVLNDDIRWLTFHSGFDFAYLLHLLIGGGTGAAPDGPTLPSSETEFFELLQLYFPCVYDVKALMEHLPPQASAQPSPAAQAAGFTTAASLLSLQRGGLAALASRLHLARLGPAHQAGSDALLTAAVFFRIRELFFEEITPPTLAALQAAAAAAGGESSKERDTAFLAASESTAALLTAHAREEERFLNLLYGLQSTANSLLRQAREKERAVFAGSAAPDADDKTDGNDSGSKESRSGSRTERD